MKLFFLSYANTRFVENHNFKYRKIEIIEIGIANCIIIMQLAIIFFLTFKLFKSDKNMGEKIVKIEMVKV